MNILERISEITQRWFLSEEALFSVFCTHRVVENRQMECPARVGKGAIEVNPILCRDMSDKELEERLRIEMIRILLKHPYERQPEGCCTTARALGSNCVLGDAYKWQRVKMERPADFKLPTGGHFEFYARRIQKLLPTPPSTPSDSPERGREVTDAYEGSSIGGVTIPPVRGARGALAENWEQDELYAAMVNEVIKSITSWGTLHGSLVEKIIASTRARIDYRKVLAGFRASILSQARRLTRMRPNRRSGFEAMGSRHDFTTRMIIGVDVSGSITSEDLSHFYTTINRFFQYGIQQIDVVQFDTQLDEVTTLSRASEHVKVKGRGGTCFQPFIDFVAAHPEYDGALIYTDGYAQQPTVPATMRTPLCWVLRSEEELKRHEQWMRQSGRVCVIEK